MNIKGTSLTGTLNFVKNTFPGRIDEWIEELPVRSRKMFLNAILATHWYPIEEGLIIPTKIIAKLFYAGNEKKASYEIGKYSAQEGLKGIYKIFIKVASPKYVLKRSSVIFKTYYEQIDAQITEDKNNEVTFYIKGFKEKEQLIFDRISGWIFEILKIIKTQPLDVKYLLVPQSGDFVDARILVKWQ